MPCLFRLVGTRFVGEDRACAQRCSAPEVLALNGYVWHSAEARQLRLGVGAIGSIPTWLCFFLAFVVLVVVRSANLVLGSTNPDDHKKRNEGDTIMNKARKTMSVALETARAVGGASWLAHHS